MCIRDSLQPSGFLLCHQISDRNVFDGLELIGIDGTCLKISTCLLQHIGPQEAANYIAAKRCVFSKSNSHVAVSYTHLDIGCSMRCWYSPLS